MRPIILVLVSVVLVISEWDDHASQTMASSLSAWVLALDKVN